MSTINIQNLTFGYDNSAENIFENVSLRLDTDWRLGFCGRNGRGKTTFLRLLLGQLEFSGSITANVDFDYFPLSIKSPHRLVSDILHNIATNAELWQMQKELKKLRLNDDVLYRPYNTLSNGEQTKVQLAALFLRENNFLLIDEPTNHLDIEGREILAAYLSGKSGFILVSHDRALLDAATTHTLNINKENIEITKGSYSVFADNKQRREMGELVANKNIEGEIDRLEKAAAQTAKWSSQIERGKIGQGPVDRGFIGHKAAKMARRTKVIQKRQEKQIEEKSKLLKNVERTFDLKITPLVYHSKRILDLMDIFISYDNRRVVNNFNLSINEGDRIVLNGKNGSGKSSILNYILANYSQKLVMSHVPQTACNLNGSLKDYADANDIDPTLFFAILNKLDFSTSQFDKDMRDFSLGQKKKVHIARSLSTKAHLYIWDEPLNYIDIISRKQIENLIINSTPTMIFVEHDRAFLNAVATNIIDL